MLEKNFNVLREEVNHGRWERDMEKSLEFRINGFIAIETCMVVADGLCFRATRA